MTVPIACSLDRASLAERAAQMAALGESMVTVQTVGTTARLGFPTDKLGALERFVAAESSCCPFFDFELADAGDRVELRVGVPEDAEWAVRGLVVAFIAGWERRSG